MRFNLQGSCDTSSAAAALGALAFLWASECGKPHREALKTRVGRLARELSIQPHCGGDRAQVASSKTGAASGWGAKSHPPRAGPE